MASSMVKKIQKNFKQATRRWTWFLYRKNRILKTQVKDLLKEDVRLHLGCGDKKFNGYVNIDIVPTEGTDVVMNISKDLHLIPPNIASEIRLDGVFEHLYRYDQNSTLQDFHRILKKGGKLCINHLPDFDTIIKAYLNKEKGIVGEVFDLFNVYRYTHGEPKPENSPQQLHKDLFTKDTIRDLLESQGFQIEILENRVFSGEEIPIGISIEAIKPL